jgi:deazaflavin-dependent oxidoreductase (nitroreductase family)
MPIPTFIGTANRHLANRITSRFAGRIPPFAIIEHHGRRSGTEYHTPIMAFPFDAGFDMALTYGSDTDWVRNVLAAGSCTLEYRGQHVRLGEPELLTAMPDSAAMPALIRLGLRVLRVHEYLRLHRVTDEVIARDTM